MLTIVGDASAFPTAGLAPLTRHSGSSIKGEARSQRGNRALECSPCLSAFATLGDPAGRIYYDPTSQGNVTTPS
ncbi:hypothetical protein GCM10009608_77390 [Pseudonocardia alaniniphila]